MIAAFMMPRLVPRAPASTSLALTGLTFLVGYVLTRAASLHQADSIIYTQFVGLRLNWILEIGGIGIVLVATFWRQSKIAKSKPGTPRGRWL
jgi:hypothetical protein